MPPNPPNAMGDILKNPLLFLQPDKALQSSILSASKQYLDNIAAAISSEQSQRQQQLRKKRKNPGDFDMDIDVLKIKRVHIDGFSVSQVFEQARKVIDSASNEIQLHVPRTDIHKSTSHHGSTSDEEMLGQEDEYSGTDLSESAEDEDEQEFSEDGMDIEDEEEEEEEEDESEGSSIGDLNESDESEDEPVEEFVPDPHGLNDGFFSIDEFNKRSEFLEDRDFRGEPADNDEEIDYDADPFSIGTNKRYGGGDADEDEDEDEEGRGPTFGNVDLNAPEGDSDDEGSLQGAEMDGVGDLSNANSIFYADFFAPPAKKTSKNKKKRGRPHPNNFPEKLEGQEDDIERTMNAVHRDLFEEEDDDVSEDDMSDLDPSDPLSRKSTNERKQMRLAKEIQRLEAANVAKRQWQLSGEATAHARPLNSLLEEDLDFERAGKPIPIVSEKTGEEIEALIKRRILAQEFDEVLRRRPDDLATGPVTRGRIQLEDTKSSQGLAEIYEKEHLQNTDPNFVDARDEKLKKEHTEIEALWKSIRGKLDSLSSWHYRPKPATANLEIRVDAPVIAMEDARPTAGGEVAGASMLAPQELYKPGDEKSKGEVVTKGGMPIAREEMSREQKLRRRRREKSKAKKALSNEAPKETKAGKESKEKKAILGDLKRGGVQVIGKKGQLTDVEGKRVRETSQFGANNLKL